MKCLSKAKLEFYVQKTVLRMKETFRFGGNYQKISGYYFRDPENFSLEFGYL